MSDDTEDFAAMFEASLKAPRIQRGQTVRGRIVAIGADSVFVDVGGKGEATIAHPQQECRHVRHQLVEARDRVGGATAAHAPDLYTTQVSGARDLSADCQRPTTG